MVPKSLSKAGAIITLLRVVDQAFDRRSWHGANLRGSIRGVNAPQARWSPGQDRKCIWDHVLHAAYWKYTVRRRLLREPPGQFARQGSNWFEIVDPSESAWKSDVRFLIDEHQKLRTVIETIQDRELDQRLEGAKVTPFELIAGIAAHDVYHAGQIQLIKRMQSA